jgi:rhomboid protease GluP
VDTQLMLAVNVMAFSAVLMAAMLSRRDWRLGTDIAIHACILALGFAAIASNWTHAGTLLAGLFVVLVLVPSLLTLTGNKKSAKGDTDSAARYARWAARVHPTPILRINASVITAQAIAEPSAAASALRAIAASAAPSYAVPLEIAALRAEDRWDSILALIAKQDAVGNDLAAYEIRGLGETGQLNEMVAEYQKFRNLLPGDMRVVVELFVLAFCGRPDAVALRADAPSSPYNEETRRYWKAIAARNADLSDDGVMEHLAHASRFGTTQIAAARHVRQGPILAAKVLSPEFLIAVDDIAKRVDRAAAIAALPHLSAIATLLLIFANGATFAAELWRGGAEDNETLYNLGALWPPAVVDGGEWWRLVTALFLHFGWAHFAINMLSLYVLGRAVEARFGTWRMLAVYLTGGIGSCAFVLGLMHAGVIEGDFLVGASGAIMALFGALAAYQFVTWLRTRDVLDRRPVLALAGVVLLQFAIDMSIPQVSLAGHASGMAIGFLAALPLALRLIRWGSD